MKNKIMELRNASAEELSAKALELKKDLFNSRIKLASGQDVKNVMAKRQIRKDIARVKTFINAKKGAK
jgi:large subunit ribosomal protein L29